MSRARVLWHYAHARRRRFADRAALERWQERHLRGVLARAPHRYAAYAGTAPRTLADLPVLDKPDVLARFAGLNTRGVGLEECVTAARAAERGRDFGTTLRGLSVGLSSGTSGQQTAFLTSAAERDRWAGEVLARALPDGLLAGARVTLVLRAGGPLYESVDGGRVQFRFVDLALPVDALVAEVVAAAPTVLVAPPSVLVLLARAGVRLPLRRVLSVAEVLDPHDRRTVEAAFGLRVDQVYQAAEGFLGISCADGRLHLAEDLVVVEREPVGPPADRRFVPVVTDLFRTSQAVLRRRLGDVLVAGDACPCGDPRQVVDEVLGRADDLLWLPGGDGVPAPLFPDFVRAAVLAAPGVRDFRVVQHAAAGLTLAVEPADAFPGARDGLVAAVARAGLGPVAITPGGIEPTGPLVKLRRVRREPHVPAPAAAAGPPAGR
ncbi:F390 synthetase-related protein [Cellulomonas sp. NPDC058312]|uniref:F390 synthetase-related protein n=1 Tax=Cellulomonas sp. NPDC058312 TaxID=3346441 RepID=UPI0036E2E03F